MRKLLIFLFVTMLGAQSVYAAAARYCEHESDGAASSHVGHHDHEHASAVNDQPPGPSTVHLDCGFCQLGFTQSLTTQWVALNLQASHAVPADVQRRIISAERDRFLRPPRTPAL
jgi:hypothetical protein